MDIRYPTLCPSSPVHESFESVDVPSDDHLMDGVNLLQKLRNFSQELVDIGQS